MVYVTEVGERRELEHKIHASAKGMSWGYLGRGPLDLARSPHPRGQPGRPVQSWPLGKPRTDDRGKRTNDNENKTACRNLWSD